MLLFVNPTRGRQRMVRFKLAVAGVPIEIEVDQPRELEETIRGALRAAQSFTEPRVETNRKSLLPVKTQEIPSYEVVSQLLSPVEPIESGNSNEDDEPSEDDDAANSNVGLDPPIEDHHAVLDYSESQFLSDFLSISLENLGSVRGREGFTAGEIYRHVLRTGGDPKLRAQNPLPSVRQALRNNERFVKKGDLWQLKEWQDSEVLIDE